MSFVMHKSQVGIAEPSRWIDLNIFGIREIYVLVMNGAETES